jgi:endonuclease/exonuclease/phosphatase family metal-dependent hydrolase
VEPATSVKGDYGLACKIEREGRQIGVIGVWTVSKQNRYLKEAEGIVERYAPFLKSGNTILAGDFNIPDHHNGEAVSSFIRGLEQRFGLVSAYHAFTGADIGSKKDATLWHHYDESQPFHCDFIFVPNRWKIVNVEVGTYAQWGSPCAEARSDHAPVIVDVLPA